MTTDDDFFRQQMKGVEPIKAEPKVDLAQQHQGNLNTEKRRKAATEELAKDKKTESSILKLLNNSVNKDFWLVSVQDQVNQAELMVTFWKEKNSNSMPKRSTQERNDLYNRYTLFMQIFQKLMQMHFKGLSCNF